MGRDGRASPLSSFFFHFCPLSVRCGGRNIFSYARLCRRVTHLLRGHSVRLQVLVVFELVKFLSPPVVGGTVVFLEVSVSDRRVQFALHDIIEVALSEYSVVRNPVVARRSFEIVQMRKAGRVVRAKDKRLEGVSVVDGVHVLAFNKAKQVVLDHGTLLHGTAHGASSVEANAVTESKYILELLVLESVLVDIESTLSVG